MKSDSLKQLGHMALGFRCPLSQGSWERWRAVYRSSVLWPGTEFLPGLQTELGVKGLG